MDIFLIFRRFCLFCVFVEFCCIWATILAGVQGTETYANVKPENTYVTRGENVTLKCGFNKSGEFGHHQIWKAYNTSAPNGINISLNEHIFNNDLNRSFSTADSGYNGKNLILTDAQPHHGGVYSCELDGLRFFSSLTVLDGKPVFKESTQSDDQSITVDCVVQYGGCWAPVLYINSTKSDQYPQIHNTTESTSKIVKTSIQLDPSEEGSCNYYCHTHFEDAGRRGCEYAIAVSAGHMASTPPRYSSVQELHLLLHLPHENHGKHVSQQSSGLPLWMQPMNWMILGASVFGCVILFGGIIGCIVWRRKGKNITVSYADNNSLPTSDNYHNEKKEHKQPTIPPLIQATNDPQQVRYLTSPFLATHCSTMTGGDNPNDVYQTIPDMLQNGIANQQKVIEARTDANMADTEYLTPVQVGKNVFFCSRGENGGVPGVKYAELRHHVTSEYLSMDKVK